MAGALVLALGVAITTVLALATLGLYHSNERRLLRLRTRELGLVLTEALPTLQTPLASAAALADATDASPRRFRAFIAPYVGPARAFDSVSLWRVGPRPPTKPTVTVGSPPAIAAEPARAAAFFARAGQTSTLSVTRLLNAADPHLGYEFGAAGTKAGWAAYGESPLPKDHRLAVAASTGFSDLKYALYLGRSHQPANLLATDVEHLPISGVQSSQIVPFGNRAFTLVVSPRQPLGGSFFANLPWIIALVGGMLSLAAALLAARLVERRQHAERLATALEGTARENRDLYAQQRDIAQTLQHAMLPDALPSVSGLEVDARYVAAPGVEVGGDWYDLIDSGNGQLFLVIGDVSGHGLDAATTMASLRHATLAYAARDNRPASTLRKLGEFVDGTAHTYLATVLCLMIDVNTRRITLASAGHLPPLLIDGSEGSFVDVPVGVPIGVVGTFEYTDTTVALPPRATLIAFTDGLVERRGEVLDAGLARLRAMAAKAEAPLGEFIGILVDELTSEMHNDDTAIVGVRWQA